MSRHDNLRIRTRRTNIGPNYVIEDERGQRVADVEWVRLFGHAISFDHEPDMSVEGPVCVELANPSESDEDSPEADETTAAGAKITAA